MLYKDSKPAKEEYDFSGQNLLEDIEVKLSDNTLNYPIINQF